jgi:hypothetical protein
MAQFDSGGEKKMKMLKSSVIAGALSAFALLGSTRAAHASLYGNFVGPDVTYQNVTENDSEIAGPPVVNSTPTGLFGAPLLIPAGSDDLMFPNMTFSAQAADGTFVLQDGKLTFNIVPTTPTANIQTLSFDEGGAWRVAGTTGDASSEATLLFNSLSITSVNGVALINPIVVTPTFSETDTIQTGSATVTPATGDITFTSTGGNAVGTWDITAGFNLTGALATEFGAAAGKDQITGISVALNDQLLANTTATTDLTLATIDKKHFNVTPGGNIPEPATLSLLLGAGLLMGRRRKSTR